MAKFSRDGRGFLTLLFAAAALVPSATVAQARDARPPPAAERLGLDTLFDSGMVLQRGAPIRVWGRARPGEGVSVRLGNQRVHVRADADGHWQGRFGAHSAGTGYRLEARAKSFHDRYSDVSIGEVWLCSGQSNMEFRRSKASDLPTNFAPDAQLRLLDVARRQDVTPSPYLMTLGSWRRSSVASAANFSAVCHHFGEQLRARLRVPVGLIEAAWGGTRIAAFVGATTLAARGLAAPPGADPQSRQQDGRVFNGMIAPIAPLTLRGVLWYQGESDTHQPGDYGARLAALADSWRRAFEQPLPMIVIQLPAFDPAPKDPSGNWAMIREAQRRFVAADGNSGLVVQIDQGSAGQLHPPAKAIVAERAATVALSRYYGRGVSAGPPEAVAAIRSGDTVRVRFSEPGTLVAKRSGGFEACDTGCVSVRARIVGPSEIALAIPTNMDVRRVRYAWADVPEPTLFDSRGWPVGPFRIAVSRATAD